VQFCCGTGDCSAAGVRKRNGAGFSGTLTSAVFVDDKGGVVIPHAVGDAIGDNMNAFFEEHGPNTSSTIESLSAAGIPIYKIGYDAPAPVEKRACEKFVEKRNIHTKTGQ
jgi:hypothetical protein